MGFNQPELHAVAVARCWCHHLRRRLGPIVATGGRFPNAQRGEQEGQHRAQHGRENYGFGSSSESVFAKARFSRKIILNSLSNPARVVMSIAKPPATAVATTIQGEPGKRSTIAAAKMPAAPHPNTPEQPARDSRRIQP